MLIISSCSKEKVDPEYNDILSTWEVSSNDPDYLNKPGLVLNLNKDLEFEQIVYMYQKDNSDDIYVNYRIANKGRYTIDGDSLILISYQNSFYAHESSQSDSIYKENKKAVYFRNAYHRGITTTSFVLISMGRGPLLIADARASRTKQTSIEEA